MKPDLPLLFINKVPEGYETEERLNVSLRPDQVRIVRSFALLCESEGETEITEN